MLALPDLNEIKQLWRYYQAGVVNTVVGFGLYSLFVYVGIDKYLAQLIAHVLGSIFNYFSYQKYVFRDAAPAKFRFMLAYGFNYLVGLASLAFASIFIQSPYLAGGVAVIIASLVNYFVLKHAVFTRRLG